MGMKQLLAVSRLADTKLRAIFQQLWPYLRPLVVGLGIWLLLLVASAGLTLLSQRTIARRVEWNAVRVCSDISTSSLTIMGPEFFVSRVEAAFALLREKCPESATSVSLYFRAIVYSDGNENGYDVSRGVPASLVLSHDTADQRTTTTAFALILYAIELREIIASGAIPDNETASLKGREIVHNARLQSAVLEQVRSSAVALGIRQETVVKCLLGEK
jgi:hypothetical protein